MKYQMKYASSEGYRDERLKELVNYQIDILNWNDAVQYGAFGDAEDVALRERMITTVKNAVTSGLISFYRGTGREFFDTYYTDLMSGHDIPLPTEQYDIDINEQGYSDLPNPHEIEPNGMYLDSTVSWCMPCGCPEAVVDDGEHWPTCQLDGNPILVGEQIND